MPLVMGTAMRVTQLNTQLRGYTLHWNLMDEAIFDAKPPAVEPVPEFQNRYRPDGKQKRRKQEPPAYVNLTKKKRR